MIFKSNINQTVRLCTSIFTTTNAKRTLADVLLRSQSMHNDCKHNKLYATMTAMVKLLSPKKPSKVALLATGDELTNGDILNTNGQAIAQRLMQHNIEVGSHAITSDDQIAIKNAIVFLLKHHDGLIITGGLGPTSDDRTRYALSAAIRKPLIFDVLSWDRIVERIKTATLRTPPESNRQQALFPKGATILENPNGTASGCMLYLQGKFIFMLPGPPHECLPMLETQVLPKLINANFTRNMFHKRWLLFGVSEGQIATELDKLVDRYQVVTGFRICYPYLEFKLHGEVEADFHQAVKIIETKIKPHILGNGINPISDDLYKKLKTIDFSIDIHDFVTGGLLESTLCTPETIRQLHFHKNTHHENHRQVTISGFEAFWSQTPNINKDQIRIQIQNGVDIDVTHTLPCYKFSCLKYAVEIIAAEILNTEWLNASP